MSTPADGGIEILLLTKPDCDFCDQAQTILAHTKDDYGLVITQQSFDTPDGERLAMTHGALFPPAIFVEGEFFCYGRFSERRLRRELDRRLARR